MMSTIEEPLETPSLICLKTYLSDLSSTVEETRTSESTIGSPVLDMAASCLVANAKVFELGLFTLISLRRLGGDD